MANTFAQGGNERSIVTSNGLKIENTSIEILQELGQLVLLFKLKVMQVLVFHR